MFIVGLTIWWFVTMLPFVVLITPPLIRGVVNAFPYLVDDSVIEATLLGDIREEGLVMSLFVPGAIMIIFGLGISYTALGVQLAGFFGDHFMMSPPAALQSAEVPADEIVDSFRFHVPGDDQEEVVRGILTLIVSVQIIA